MGARFHRRYVSGQFREHLLRPFCAAIRPIRIFIGGSHDQNSGLILDGFEAGPELRNVEERQIALRSNQPDGFTEYTVTTNMRAMRRRRSSKSFGTLSTIRVPGVPVITIRASSVAGTASTTFVCCAIGLSLSLSSTLWSARRLISVTSASVL